MPASGTLQLRGCTSEPLGNYLKALGIFRLVAEQVDPGARCWWRGGVFHIFLPRGTFNTSAALADWLLGECAFSPFIAPWQTGSGFLPLGKRSEGMKALKRILESEKPSYRRWQKSFAEFVSASGGCLPSDRKRWLEAAHQLPEMAKLSKEVEEGASGKARTHLLLRSSITDSAGLAWLDAVGSVVTTGDDKAEPKWFWLLANGGGESSGKYIVNLQQRLVDRLEGDAKLSRAQLLSALDGCQFPGTLQADAMGAMYFPALMESYNPGQAFSSKPKRRVNPWDFILLLEGTLLWASAATRRGSVSRRLASFPFYCRASLGGSRTLAPKEAPGAEGSISRGELWCPAWAFPSSLPDVRRVFGEGRLQVGEETADSSLEFVRSIARFGAERGIGAFLRYGLLARSGSGRQTTLLAVPLGTFAPQHLPDVDLLHDLDSFREQIEDIQPNANQPRRLVLARARLEQAVFAFASQTLNLDTPERDRRLLDVLLGAAGLERELGVTNGEVKYKRGNETTKRLVRPIAPLSRRWLFREPEGGCPVDDGSAEFRLARSIASICPWGEVERNGNVVPAVESLRSNLLRLTRSGGKWSWDPRSRSAVWTWGLPLLDNLARVLQRRFIDASGARGDGPPLWGTFGARFTDVLKLWAGQLDEERLEQLVFALALADSPLPAEESIGKRQAEQDPTPDLAPTGVWFDSQDEPHVKFAPLIWRRRTLIDRHDLQSAATLPRAYALLKLCFVGGRLPPRPVAGETVSRTGREPYPPCDTTLLNLLLAGHDRAALVRAAQKLRARGYPPIASDAILESEGLGMNTEQCRRMAGLLLLPCEGAGVLAGLAIKPGSA